MTPEVTVQNRLLIEAIAYKFYSTLIRHFLDPEKGYFSVDAAFYVTFGVASFDIIRLKRSDTFGMLRV